MREKMSDSDYYKLNQCHGDPETAHDLAVQYFKEGRELEATVASMKAEIAHLNTRIARYQEMIETGKL